ncbi:MAG: hypothetical protein K9N51_00030 [Candidatus Pacebacteria bacterium]|nr:hypothetical protein [Candidatus Paceibacterota bacterium]
MHRLSVTILLTSVLCGAIFLNSGCREPSGKSYRFVPLELTSPPVNGTDETETPSILREVYGFGDRPSKKIVEHGATPALLQGALNALETPHTEWANAYEQPPVRILWVVEPREGLRDMMEIRQRSNFEITPLMIPSILGSFPNAEAMNSLLSERYDEILSKEYDVIVLRGFIPWWRKDTPLPTVAPVFERLEAKIRAGTGAVGQLGTYFFYKGNVANRAAFEELTPIGYGDGGMSAIVETPERTAVSSPVSDGITFAPWPKCQLTKSRADKDAEVLATAKNHAVVATGRYGKGRVAAFHYATQGMGSTGLVPRFQEGDTPRIGDSHEAIYAAWLRAIAWAANKAPRIGLQAAEVTPTPSGTSPQMKITVTANQERPPPATLQYRLTDATGERLYEDSQPLDLSGTSATVTPSLPVLHANGLYRLDMWVKSDGKTYNWGTAAIDVTGGTNLSVNQLDNHQEPGDALSFQVDIGDTSGNLQSMGVDANNRVFFDRTQRVTGTVTVHVDTLLSQLPMNRVFFTLRDPDTGDVLARKAVQVYLPRIGIDAMDGQFGVFSYGRTKASVHLRPYTGLLYRAAGFNGIYFNNHSRGRLQNAADEGLFGVAGKSWQFSQKGFSKVHRWTPNDPEKRAKLSEQIDTDITDIRAYGSVSRVLDDESWFAWTGSKNREVYGAQLSQDKWSVELFREAMRKKYGDIAALNDMWGTDFASFNDVRVIEEDEIEALGNPSGWLEFREYMNWTYAVRYYGWVSKQHEEVLGDDYRAGCGAPHWRTSAGGPTYRGGDLSKMRGHMRFMMLYGGGSPGAAYVGQPGGQKYDPPQVWKDYGPWKHILTGADALWYYFGNAIIGSELAWRRHAVWVQEGLSDVIRGCGALLSGAERSSITQIRTLSTSQNQHMGWLYHKRDDAWKAVRLYGGRPQSAGTFSRIMSNLFVPVGGISEQSIEDGALQDDCKLLFLPQQINMSDAAVAAIRTYVRNGGTVLADILPATRHQMGKPRHNTALADVFGVDCANARLHASSEASSIVFQSPPRADIVLTEKPVRLTGPITVLGIKPTTAVAHAEISPVDNQGSVVNGCFVNSYGKGHALLLNFVYKGLNNDTLDHHQAFAHALLKWAGIDDPAERIVDPRTGDNLHYRPLYRFTRGKARLLGSIRGNFVGGNNPRLWDSAEGVDQTNDAMFTWSGKRHAYDVRSRRYLGFGESATIDLPPFEGRLLCLLPYKVTGVQADIPRRTTAGNVLSVPTTIRTSGEQPGEHVLYIDVTSPSGARRPLYCKTKVAPAGRAVFQIPFALNDPVGKWTVTIRDVMSGMQTTKKIHLHK